MAQDRTIAILSDKEIYRNVCPTCFSRPKQQCFGNRGEMLNLAHPMRIKQAQEMKLRRLFGKALNSTDKSLVLYYAFIMLCDSVSTKAPQVLGVEMDSERIQAFFAGKAIEELKKDGLLPNG